MLEQFAQLVAKEVDRAATSVLNTVKRRLLLFVLKAVFMVLSLTIVTIGIVLLGGKYVGVDVMMVIVGLLLLVGFLVVK